MLSFARRGIPDTCSKPINAKIVFRLKDYENSGDIIVISPPGVSLPEGRKAVMLRTVVTCLSVLIEEITTLLTRYLE